MTLDRTIAPPSKIVERVNIPAAQKITLANQLKLYRVKAGEQPVVRIEFIFEAGSCFDIQYGQSFFTAKMLSEGTKKHNSEAINSFFDQFGSFIEINQSADRLVIVVHSLTKHLVKVLPMIRALLTESIFPEQELLLQKNIASQSLKVNLEKTAFVASHLLREQLFGKQHAYGKYLTQTDIDSIDRKTLVDFYEKKILGNPFTIFISGNFGELEIEAIEQVFSTIKIKTIDTEARTLLSEVQPQNILVERPDNLQSSIRLGRKLFNRSHPDFFKFIVTNTLFGGYFGSRLMKNIREEKGFTYGISSSIIPQKQEGYLVIGTDVKKEFTQQTLDEVFKEIRILQTETVSVDELETVKNYLIGSLVGSLNTPFEVADRQKIIILENLPADFYENYIQKVLAISAEDVKQMANKYYNQADLCEIVVGGK